MWGKWLEVKEDEKDRWAGEAGPQEAEQHAWTR